MCTESDTILIALFILRNYCVHADNIMLNITSLLCRIVAKITEPPLKPEMQATKYNE